MTWELQQFATTTDQSISYMTYTCLLILKMGKLTENRLALT